METVIKILVSSLVQALVSWLSDEKKTEVIADTICKIARGCEKKNGEFITDVASTAFEILDMRERLKR